MTEEIDLGRGIAAPESAAPIGMHDLVRRSAVVRRERRSVAVEDETNRRS